MSLRSLKKTMSTKRWWFVLGLGLLFVLTALPFLNGNLEKSEMVKGSEIQALTDEELVALMSQLLGDYEEASLDGVPVDRANCLVSLEEIADWLYDVQVEWDRRTDLIMEQMALVPDLFMRDDFILNCADACTCDLYLSSFERVNWDNINETNVDDLRFLHQTLEGWDSSFCRAQVEFDYCDPEHKHLFPRERFGS